MIGRMLLPALMLPGFLIQDTVPRPGPHAVGFQVIGARDSTRAFVPKRSWTGELAEDTSRPVQISVWYPAESVGEGPGMQAWEFRALAEMETVALTPAEAEARARTRYFSAVASLDIPTAEALRLWEDTLPPRRAAPVLPGRHPLVLYFGSAGTGNAALPAYLASHGYVVASFPSNGRMTDASIAFTPNEMTLDTDIDDAGFVLATMRRLPFVDADQLAIVTFSATSLAALLWQMRDMQGDALVLVEGWERYRTGAALLRTSPHYDPRRVRAPLLLLERAADETSPAYAKVGDVVDSLHYAAVRRVSFRDALHVDFLSHPFAPSEHHPGIYATSAAMILQFLAVSLGREPVSEPVALAAFNLIDRPARPAQPTEEELFRLAESDPREAARIYRTTKQDGPPVFRQAVLSRAALFARTAADRVIILDIVVDAYPLSVDARFRLGEALLAADRTDEGEASLRAAADIIDRDPTLDDTARAAWRNRIETRLAQR